MAKSASSDDKQNKKFFFKPRLVYLSCILYRLKLVINGVRDSFFAVFGFVSREFSRMIAKLVLPAISRVGKQTVAEHAAVFLLSRVDYC